MLVLFFLFPVSLVTTVIAGALYLVWRGWPSPAFRTCLLILAYLVMCYAISFIVVSTHPYWEDNGAQEFIPIHERWSWAILFASFFQLILSPVLWAASWAIGRKRQALLRKKQEILSSSGN